MTDQHIQTSVHVYSVVHIPEGGRGVVSRTIGTNKLEAIERAEQRRKDFPTAEIVRVVSPTLGIVYEI
jgi:hypothetical protein